MPPRPAQKRAAESRGSTDAGSSHAPKKTRIVEPTEDPANFAEQVDAALEDPAARSKRRVKTEGYDSDSSEDEEGPRRRADPAGGGPGAADEDDDMFAIGERDTAPDADGVAGAKKEPEFLRLGDIEGQEFNEEHASDASSDVSDDPVDEDEAERRKKAGMGFELSSFNMREEMEEGKFTEDGMYMRTYDAHVVHDRWLDGTDEREMKQAKRRKKEREKAEKERQKAEEKELQDMGGKEQLERDLLSTLKRGETVLEALQRLGAQAKKAKSLANGKQKRDAAPPKAAANKDAKEFSPIEHVTHIASMLMSIGDSEIYSKTYEELVRSVRAAGKVPPDWDPPSADVRYEYKWDVPGATSGDQVFGPYSEDEMKAWHKAAYFGVDAEKIKVRTVGGEWGSWDDVVL